MQPAHLLSCDAPRTLHVRDTRRRRPPPPGPPSGRRRAGVRRPSWHGRRLFGGRQVRPRLPHRHRPRPHAPGRRLLPQRVRRAPAPGEETRASASRRPSAHPALTHACETLGPRRDGRLRPVHLPAAAAAVRLLVPRPGGRRRGQRAVVERHHQRQPVHELLQCVPPPPSPSLTLAPLSRCHTPRAARADGARLLLSAALGGVAAVSARTEMDLAVLGASPAALPEAGAHGKKVAEPCCSSGFAYSGAAPPRFDLRTRVRRRRERRAF